MVAVLAAFITLASISSCIANDESCDAGWVIMFLFIGLTLIASCVLCGFCCGMFGNSFAGCIRDSSYIQVNSFMVTIFGGILICLLIPFLFVNTLADSLFFPFLFALSVFGVAVSCIIFCVKPDDAEDESLGDKKKVKQKVLYAIPSLIFLFAGVFILNLRTTIFNTMTGPAYFFSPTGYYTNLDSSKSAISFADGFDNNFGGDSQNDDDFEAWFEEQYGDEKEDGETPSDDPDAFPDAEDVRLLDELSEVVKNHNPTLEDEASRLLSESNLNPELEDILKDFARDNCDPALSFCTEELETTLTHHCTNDDLKNIIFGKIDRNQCNPFLNDMNGCTAGFYYNEETGQGVICPNGFFCPEKFRCLIACVKGASCTATEKTSDSMCTHAVGFQKIVEPAIVEDGDLTCPGPAHELICPVS